MSKVKCNSCDGTYSNTQEDGTAYHHVCPDRIVEEPEVTHPETNEIVTPTKFKPVANPRNENLKPHPDKPGEHVLISEGNDFTLLD